MAWSSVLGVLIADMFVMSVLSFFIARRHLPDRGATPLAGARVPFFGANQEQRLRDSRAMCEGSGRSLIPWAIVYYSTRAWPWALGLALALFAARGEHPEHLVAADFGLRPYR